MFANAVVVKQTNTKLVTYYHNVTHGKQFEFVYLFTCWTLWQVRGLYIVLYHQELFQAILPDLFT